MRIKTLCIQLLLFIYCALVMSLPAQTNPWQLPFDLQHARTIQTLELEMIRSPFSKARESVFKKTWRKTQNMESDLIFEPSQLPRFDWSGEIRFPVFCLRFLTRHSDEFKIQTREDGRRVFRGQSKSAPFAMAITNQKKHTAMYTINDDITIKEAYYLDRKKRTLPQTQRIFWYFEDDEINYRLSWTIRYVDFGYFPSTTNIIQKASPRKLDRSKYEGLLKQLKSR